LIKENIFSTAPDVLPSFCGDVATVKKKHEACHSRQDVNSEKQARTGLLYVEKRCGSSG